MKVKIFVSLDVGCMLYILNVKRVNFKNKTRKRPLFFHHFMFLFCTKNSTFILSYLRKNSRIHKHIFNVLDTAKIK